MDSLVVVNIIGAIMMYLVFLAACSFLRRMAKWPGVVPSVRKDLIRKSNLGFIVGTGVFIAGCIVSIFHVFVWIMWVGVMSAFALFVYLTIVNYRRRQA